MIEELTTFEKLIFLFSVLTFIFQICILIQVHKLNSRGEKIMTSLEALQAQMAELDAETTRIADLLEEQIQQLQTGTITIDQLNEIVTPQIERLRALGH